MGHGGCLLIEGPRQSSLIRSFIPRRICKTHCEAFLSLSPFSRRLECFCCRLPLRRRFVFED
ncbi:unnamed protein product [Brassica rapa subsp. trilocularis]